jgi:uncharacterized membrane protein YtjA (UPF0391 family)
MSAGQIDEARVAHGLPHRLEGLEAGSRTDAPRVGQSGGAAGSGSHTRDFTLAHQGGRRTIMLGWALVFFIVAIIAAVFGFGGIAAAAAGVAKILFYVFLVAFLVMLVAGLVRRP